MNRLNDLSIIVIGVIIGACALVGIISSKYLGRDDAFIEEFSEEVIAEFTGVSIDLTPDSPEN